MRVLIGVLTLSAAFASPAFAGPEEEALQVVEKWAAAFRASDAMKAIVASYLEIHARLTADKTDGIKASALRLVLDVLERR